MQTLEPDSRLGAYRIVRRLGQGGMAENVDERQGIRLRSVRSFRKTMARAKFLQFWRNVPFMRKRAALPWTRRIDFATIVVVKKDAGSVCSIRKYQRLPILR